MKTAVISPIRVEPELRRYLEQAAAFENRSLCNFLMTAALERAEQLRAKGWNAKPAPQSRDGRRKAARVAA